MEVLGLKKTVVQIAKVNRVRWYGHVLRRDDVQVLRKALELKSRSRGNQDVQRRRGRRKWRRKARVLVWRKGTP